MFQNLINPEVPLTVPRVAGQASREPWRGRWVRWLLADCKDKPG